MASCAGRRPHGATDGVTAPAADLPPATPLSQLLVPPSPARTGSAAGRGASRGSNRRPQAGWGTPAATTPISGTLPAVDAAITTGEGAAGGPGAAQVAGPTAGGWVRKATAHREGDRMGVGRLGPAAGGGSDPADANAAGGWAVTAAGGCPCGRSMGRCSAWEVSREDGREGESRWARGPWKRPRRARGRSSRDPPGYRDRYGRGRRRGKTPRPRVEEAVVEGGE